MKDILQQNGRIEQKDGLHFYEQDIVMLDYLYNGDITIDMQVDYHNPGIGIVVAKQNLQSLAQMQYAEMYVIKIGMNDFTIFKKSYAIQEKIYFAANRITPEDTTQSLRFSISGTVVRLYQNSLLINEYDLSTIFSNYFIGIYSNKNNTIKSFKIYDNRPQFWFTNITNTNGGRVSFKADQFLIENAEKPIEIEQTNISLQPGQYYLGYVSQTNSSDQNNDIECYVFDSKEPNIKAAEKNMLDAKNAFKVSDNQKVNILFRGHEGIIKNICFKDNYDQPYVSTSDSITMKQGSYAQISLEDLSKITWSGTINEIPEYSLLDKIPYSIITYGSQITETTLQDIGMLKNQAYSFLLAVDKDGKKWTLSVSDNNKKEIYETTFEYQAGEDLIVFKNVEGIISNIIITKSSGESTDILVQRTVKKYVPCAITSPIIVTDNEDYPFDLSSSYRYTADGKYIFTNWEREIFPAAPQVRLVSKINDIVNGIIVYGIKNKDASTIDLSLLYNVMNNSMINSIDCLTKHYDIISSNMFSISDSSQIIFDDKAIEGYKYFIIDYLKDRSYCINMTSDQQYEVDISSADTVVKTIYELETNGQVRKYKALDNLSVNENMFIVLKHNEVKA